MSMTENNYDKLKDAICELVNLAEDATSRDVFEMLDNAGADIIDCLDKLSGFEAIGTIEEIQSKLDAYKELGTMEELKALKEKSVAKKAIRRTGMCYAKAKDGTDNYEIIEECPTCKKRLCAVSFNVGYCKCGQKITI